jgi:hypothetical protein
MKSIAKKVVSIGIVLGLLVGAVSTVQAHPSSGLGGGWRPACTQPKC